MTDRSTGQGRAALLSDDVEFDATDAALLRAIRRTGSVARAAETLCRSRARALSRLETLEDAFGAGVERRRGGSDGGGSRLTAETTALLARFSRLQAALSATATVPETVLDGSVTAVDGELATLSTPVGPVRGRHDAVTPGEDLQARIAADAITVLAPDGTPDPDATSARNRLDGLVRTVDRGETVATARVDVDETAFRALVTTDSAEVLDLAPGRSVVLTWKATATPLVPVGDPTHVGRGDGSTAN
jgi:molybdate transport system regulatory protein